MKSIFLYVAFTLFILPVVISQSVGIGTSAPNASAALEIKANNQGMLIPRTSSTSRIAIVNPAKGLMLYDTTTSSFWFHNGGAWVQLGGDGWSLTGNASTNPSTNFIGTTDYAPLRFRINSAWAGEIDPVNRNTLVGVGAGNATYTGSQNAALGNAALQAITTGSYNTATGASALSHNTSGNDNTAIGADALLSSTTANNNVAIGSGSMASNTTGFANAAVGRFALNANTTGYNNVAVGYLALGANTTAVGNSAVGFSSQSATTTGGSNSSLGWQSLLNNTTGTTNCAVGFTSLIGNTGGVGNVGIGYQVLLSNSTGSFNTAMGFQSMYYLNGGSRNIAIGYGSGTDPGSPGVSNTISIGNEGFFNAASNQVFIGNFSTGYCGAHASWSVFSDARIKTNIKEEVKGLDFIMRLRPVTYYKSIKAMVELTGNKETPDFPGKYDVEKIKLSGFLAQEVEQAANESGYVFSGIHKPVSNKDLYSLSYETFVVPLVKAVQEQEKIIEQQKNEIDEMKLRLKAIEEKMK